MSDELIVAVGVVGALVLCETVLPWAFTALRRWRREQARVSNRTVAVSATGAVTAEPLASATVPAASSLRGAVTVGPLDSATRRGAAGTVGDPDAVRLWEEARRMTHRFNPDEIRDSEYLRKIQMAAELGHLEAMAKLGTYAFRRMRYVEAFYWRWRAEAGGWHGTEKPTLREIRLEWRLRGCPTEYDNDLGEDRGKFARAVLRLQCGVDAAGARQRLKRLAERGVEEARLFLGK